MHRWAYKAQQSSLVDPARSALCVLQDAEEGKGVGESPYMYVCVCVRA